MTGVRKTRARARGCLPQHSENTAPPTGHSRAMDHPVKKLLMKNHNLAKKSIPSFLPRVTEIFSNPQTPRQPLHPEGPSSPLCRPISVSLRALTASTWAFLIPSYRVTKRRLCYFSGLQTGWLKTVEMDRLPVLEARSLKSSVVDRTLSETYREDPSWPLVAPAGLPAICGAPCLQLHHSSLCLHLHVASSPRLCVSPWPSRLLRSTPVLWTP